MRQPVQVLVFCYRETARGREYLMLHRKPEAWAFWQPVSGGVEDDEDLLTTARRELKEETGFDADAIEDLKYCYYIPVAHDSQLSQSGVDALIPVNLFAVKIEDGRDPVLDENEHDDFRWCSIEIADRLLFWHNDRESLRQVEEWVDGR